MASDIFLYATTAIAFLSCVGNAQPFFGNNNNNGYPSSTIQRGYQPPPSPPLLPQFYQQPQHQHQQQQQRQYQFGPFQPQFVAQKPQPTTITQNAFTPSITYPIDYPVTSSHVQPQRINNQIPQNYNTQPIPPPPPSMRFIPNPHPPIIINTLIQVYVDGKNKTVGNPALEGRVVTGIQNNDRVILTKEFDVKTHKFIEENGKEKINQKNLIQVNAVADTNSTKIARDDLQKELEKELEHSIPLILDELDKVKINNKINMAKDNMMTDNLNTQKGKNTDKHGNEEEVSIEDLEKLIRDGLNELEDSEAKKQLEKEFKEVVEATTTTSEEKLSTSNEPPPTSSTKVQLPTTQEPFTVTEEHETITLTTPNAHESNMVIREMGPSQIGENEDAEVSVSTLPPGVVTFIATNIEPVTEAETLTTDETPIITTLKAINVTPEKPEMMAPIKAMIIKSQESIEKEEEEEKWRSTPEPAEMMAPERAMMIESEEDVEIEDQTPMPAEMIMPVKAMIIKSAEEIEASTHAPVTAEMIVPSLAMMIKSEEETEEDVTVPITSTTTSVPTSTVPKTTPTTPPTTTTPETEAPTTSTLPPTTVPIIVIATTELLTEPPTESKTELSTTELITTEIPITVIIPTTEQTTTELPTTTEVTTEPSTTESTTELTSTTEIETTTPEITETSTLATTTEETTIITSTTSEATAPTTTFTTTATPSTTTTITLPFASEQCEIPNDESEKLKGDVLFLLDSSTSVGNQTFQKAVQLVKQIVLNFSNIGPKGVQFALIQYNREPWLEFTFRRHTCLSLLLDDIEDTEFMNGPSNLGRALNKVMKFAFTPARGDRPDVENIVVLVSDGLSEDKVQLPVTLSRQNGTTPIVVATLQAKKDILMDIAEKDENNMFNLTEAIHKPLGERLAQRIKDILKSNENAENPPTTTTVSLTSTTTPGKEISEAGEMMMEEMMQQNEVEPNTMEMELTAAPIVPMVPTEDDSVQVVCSHDGINAQFQIEENYGGIIVARDFSNSSDCAVAIPVINKHSKNLRQISINLKYSECGISVVQSDFPKGINYSLVLNLLHNKEIVTARDKSFIIQCFRPTTVINSTLEAQLDVIGGIPITKTISLTVAPPKCHYSLRQDTYNGPIVQKARIGQVIYHRWECEGENVTNSVYGLYVHNCKATNNTKQDFSIINKNGCSADSTLLNEITYSNDKLLAYAKSYVFTLVDVSTLLFTCKVSLCVRDGDGCEGYSPPVCPLFNSTTENDVLLTRRVRNYDGALQTALTSELSTTMVDVSDPLSAIRIHQLHLPIAVVIILALLLGSIMGVIWHFCQNKNPKKIFSRNGTSHGSTFPDDESTTDKSETLSFRSLDFRTPEERSMDLSEVVSSPSSPEVRRPSTTTTT